MHSSRIDFETPLGTSVIVGRLSFQEGRAGVTASFVEGDGKVLVRFPNGGTFRHHIDSLRRGEPT